MVAVEGDGGFNVLGGRVRFIAKEDELRRDSALLEG